MFHPCAACIRDKGAGDGPDLKANVLSLFDEWLRLTAGSAALAAYATNPAAGAAGAINPAAAAGGAAAAGTTPAVVAAVPEADRTALAAFLANVRAAGWLQVGVLP
jgi:hypothetical protein